MGTIALCTGAGNVKGGIITVPLTSCFTGLDWSVLQIKTKIVSCQTADSKPVTQEVNGTVILPPLVFPDRGIFAKVLSYRFLDTQASNQSIQKIPI